jgi:hypothetical protein
MRSGIKWLPVVVLGMAISAHAQLTKEARLAIVSGMIATEGAARIPMPLGKTGVELSENGVVARDKLQKEISDNGAAIAAGAVVSITAIEFSDKSIEFEIDGGGSKKGGILSRIQVGVGAGGPVSTQGSGPQAPALRGSKVTLKFSGKAPKDLSVEQLKTLLNPVLDFSKQSLARTGIEALPPEFQEAVRLREARIGMDENTVLLAMGQPNNRIREKNSKGVDQEDWKYEGRGRRVTFVTFENGVVVEIRQYE